MSISSDDDAPIYFALLTPAIFKECEIRRRDRWLPIAGYESATRIHLHFQAPSPPPRPRYLRVVTLADGATVHNAFFDRNFREDQR
jgi:hypothetical protein